jgi:hypothetical protein
MNLRSFSTRLASLLVAFVLIVGAWSAAQAYNHGLTGNMRFQIGDGLPIPIGFQAPPNGPINPIAGATVMMFKPHALTAPAAVQISPFQFFFNANPINIPVGHTNPIALQVKTNLTLQWPKSQITFSAGKRTGAAIVTFCGQPGSTVTPSGNPGCAGGTTGTGKLRYAATSHQFGGPAQGNTAGTADVAVRTLAQVIPCAGANCKFKFFNAGPAPTGAVGGPFGFTNNTIPTTPNPGSFTGSISVMGKILLVGTPQGPGTNNFGTSWGGPWTTGMLTVQAPDALGAPETFILAGADGRAAGTGMGSLSLVAGGFSQRAITGPNANRGWLNMTIAASTEAIPLMPAYGVAALIALTGISGAYVLRRRKRA